MNGRVYDPLLGRCMTAHPFVQSPNFLQSFNRYSYVFNNPLRAVDPEGFSTAPIRFCEWGGCADWDLPALDYGDFSSSQEEVSSPCRKITCGSLGPSANIIYLNPAVYGDYVCCRYTTSISADGTRRMTIEAFRDSFIDPNLEHLLNGVQQWWNTSMAAFQSSSATDFVTKTLEGWPVGGAVVGSLRLAKGLGAASGSLRAIRSAYVQGLDDLVGLGLSMRAAGASAEQAVRELVPLRNQLKLDLRAEGSWFAALAADFRNLIRYGNRAGPTADDLYRQYGSWERAFEALGHSNPRVDSALGVVR